MGIDSFGTEDDYIQAGFAMFFEQLEGEAPKRSFLYLEHQEEAERRGAWF